MEKFSLNDVLALLMPGLYAIGCIEFIVWAAPAYEQLTLNNKIPFFDKSDINTFFLFFAAIVLGAVSHRVTALIMEKKWHRRKSGLYKRTGIIFYELKTLHDWTDFYNEDCKKKFGTNYDGEDIVAKNTKEHSDKKLTVQGKYFDYVFHAVAHNEKTNAVLVEQHFYFLFRNLTTVSIMSCIASVICFIFFWISKGWCNAYTMIIISGLFLILAQIIFAPIGAWYRKRMVRVLFYRYYIEKSGK